MAINKNRILFRTSGGKAPKKQLGMGHVFRCINLAKTFKDKEIFFLVEDYGNVREILSKNHFKNIIILKKKYRYQERHYINYRNNTYQKD